MADPQTVNVGLSVPTRGSDVGVWDVPVNGDFTATDGFFGGVQTISASSAPITLTSPVGFTPTPSGGPTQAQNAVIRVTGTLSGNVTVTLPLPGYMIIENLTTAGGNVVVFRAIGSGEIVCVDQGSVQHVYNDGTNVRFVNLQPVGTYLDVGISTVPAWIASCTKPPFLLCDGSTFNATTYPYLNQKLGGNTLPDFRGRSGYYMNTGTGRLTSGGAGIDGNTIFAGGGTNGIVASQLPGVTSNGVTNIIVASNVGQVAQGSGIIDSGAIGGSGARLFGGSSAFAGSLASSGNNNISVTSNNTQGVGTTMPNAPPGVMSGIRLIRAA